MFQHGTLFWLFSLLCATHYCLVLYPAVNHARGQLLVHRALGAHGPNVPCQRTRAGWTLGSGWTSHTRDPSAPSGAGGRTPWSPRPHPQPPPRQRSPGGAEEGTSIFYYCLKGWPHAGDCYRYRSNASDDPVPLETGNWEARKFANEEILFYVNYFCFIFVTCLKIPIMLF